MRSIAEFGKWLWGDWGRPNFLTALGIPRLVISPPLHLPALYLLYLLTIQSGVDKQAFGQMVRNPFLLLGYAVFYLSSLIYQFVESKYHFGKRAKLWQNRNDPIVAMLMAAFVAAFILFLIGAWQFRSTLK